MLMMMSVMSVRMCDPRTDLFVHATDDDKHDGMDVTTTHTILHVHMSQRRPVCTVPVLNNMSNSKFQKIIE
jgi:hypothetical protein